jgi:type III pantothenate kinase
VANHALLLDVGNSRIKWAHLKEGQLHEGEAFAYKNEQVGALFDSYWGELAGIPSVVISNVGGTEIAIEIESWCLNRWEISSTFIKPIKQGFGIINSYQNPLKLGVDRWVCLVGAHATNKEPTCVVDCGTAVTVDVLSKKGEHLGGMITPGIQLMKSTLLSNTSDIGEAGNNPKGFLGKCTADAVQNGAIHSITGLIERVICELKKEHGELFQLILTGGDAELIKNHLNCDARLIGDLALKGLSVITRDQAK